MFIQWHTQLSSIGIGQPNLPFVAIALSSDKTDKVDTFTKQRLRKVLYKTLPTRWVYFLMRNSVMHCLCARRYVGLLQVVVCLLVICSVIQLLILKMTLSQIIFGDSRCYDNMSCFIFLSDKVYPDYMTAFFFTQISYHIKKQLTLNKGEIYKSKDGSLSIVN